MVRLTRCSHCGGDGILYNEECSWCDGTGLKEDEVTEASLDDETRSRMLMALRRQDEIVNPSQIERNYMVRREVSILDSLTQRPRKHWAL